MYLLVSLDGCGSCVGGHGVAFCSFLLYVLVVVVAGRHASIVRSISLHTSTRASQLSSPPPWQLVATSSPIVVAVGEEIDPADANATAKVVLKN